jgi:hypothetical protein
MWLLFAFLTVVTWGLYGVLLHTGQLAMGDPVAGRYKAFLWVGIAYVLIAVLAPLAMLRMQGADMHMSASGILWSLFAGITGAVGAFGVLLAFGAKGNPAVVMSIVFAGAPVVNALAAMIMHPPAGGFASTRWQFVLGIVLAAAGGTLVSLYKPQPAAAPAASPAAAPASAPGDGR